MTGAREDWRPGASLDRLRLRARLMADLREWFAERRILEVQTPALSVHAATDPNIESLSAGARDREYFLHTSPEFPMKRLLAAGSGDIYQVCRVFRASEAGRRHNPEFTMLEWYRIGMDMFDLMDDVGSLIRHLMRPVRSLGPSRRVAYRELIEVVAGIDPLEATAVEIEEALAAKGVEPPGNSRLDRQALLDLLLCAVVEPTMDPNEPLFVYHFPAEQAALARISPSDSRVAERFELFLGGMEIANGFHELADAAEQRERFVDDNVRRETLGRRPMPMDVRMLAALDHGLPDCSGVALGIDRLLMYIAGAARIGDVLAFDIDRA